MLIISRLIIFDGPPFPDGGGFRRYRDMRFQEDMPGVIFQSLARARHQAFCAELSRCGLKDLGQPMILALLQKKGREEGAASQRELADAMRVSPATIAVSLKSLEREGYVEKRGDPADQRRKAVRLTKKGEDAVRTSFQAFQAVDEKMFRGFTPAEIAQATAFHRRMLQNLRGELPPERMNCTC